MKKIILMSILTILLFTMKIPPYIELNNLSIIESIGIDYNNINNKFKIYLKDIKIYKDNNGINYKYVYYSNDDYSLNKAIRNVSKKINKKIYLNKLDIVFINNHYKNRINKELKNINYNTKKFKYTNKSIKKVIRKYSNY